MSQDRALDVHLNTAEDVQMQTPENLTKSAAEVVINRFLLDKIGSFLDPVTAQQCSRVCKAFNAVFRNSEVKLACVPIDALPRLAERMPNTAALAIDIGEREDGMRLLLNIAAQFPRLRQLSISYENRLSPTAARNLTFASLQQLQELSITVDREDFPLWFAQGLRQLTALKSLALAVYGLTNYDVVPFTELNQIERLSLTVTLLLNVRGQHLFPPTATLTHLSIIGNQKEAFIPESVILQLLGVYAPYLQTLSIISEHGTYYLNDWTPLSEFSKLTGLSLKESRHSQLDLLNILTDMDSLTDLDAGTIERMTYEDVRTLTTLRRLRSLSIAGDNNRFEPDVTILRPLSNLTQLTRLSVRNVHAGTELRQLSMLVDIELWVNGDTIIDVPITVRNLPRLERVVMDGVRYSRELVDSLAGLRELRSLRFCTLDGIDGTFFPALEELSQLTHLALGCRFTDMGLATLMQVNHLRHLIHLQILTRFDQHPCAYLRQGCLCNLRKLSIVYRDLSEIEMGSLLEAFPYLDAITILSAPSP